MERDRHQHDPTPPDRALAQPEHETTPYVHAARFRREGAATRAYQQAQTIIAREDVDLSVFRFLVDNATHVAVIGEQPPPATHIQIERTLAYGEYIDLAGDVLDLLHDRRRLAQQIGPWVEGHYQPGRRFRLPERDQDESF